MKPVFIYSLNDPATEAIRYVGRTNNPDLRLKMHMCSAPKLRCHRACWIQSLLKKGLRPVMEILDVVPDNEADFWECEYIQNFREQGFDLTNGTDGGGAPPSRVGIKHTPEWKAAMSVRMTGERHPDYGSKHSPERCEKNRLARLGKKLSPESIAKRTATNRIKKTSRNTSGFVGVSWNNHSGKWLTQLYTNNNVYSSKFSKIEDAVFVRALLVDKYCKGT